MVQTPNDVLVDKLGLDIPPAPEITLEEIFATEVRISWNQAEFSNSIHKHIVEVNGVKGGWVRKRTESLADRLSGGDEADGEQCVDTQPCPRRALRCAGLHCELTWIPNAQRRPASAHSSVHPRRFPSRKRRWLSDDSSVPCKIQ